MKIIKKKKIFYAKKIVFGCGTLVTTRLIMDFLKIEKEVKIKEHPRLISMFFSKYKIENLLIEISKKEKLNYTILRYFNVAGADKNNRSGLISKSSSNLIKVLCEVVNKKREKIIIVKL